MEKQPPRHGRVVLVPCPFQGHINPMLQLGTILHSHGCSITVVHTKFNSPDPSSHPEFNFQPLTDGLSHEDICSGNLVAIILAINSNCKTSFQECITRITQQHKPNEKITCIIYDELMYFSEAAANHLKLSSMILRTTSVATVLSRLAIRQLKEEGRIPWQDSMSQDRVPDLPSLRFKDLPVSIFGVPDNFLDVIAQMYDVRKSSAVIWNTIDCLEQSLLEQQQQQCPIPIFPIGPLHKFAPVSSSSLLNEDTSCITWLDKQTHNSVLYISLGSLASIDEIEVAEMAWGLANSRQPFLWVVRPGSIAGSEWIESLPEGFRETVGERGCIVKWAPQKEVLAHPAVGGFWSHCGWNSTLESISEGVPMICKPCFGDQRVNARYVSYVWGIGLQLENKMERKEIERAIRSLMVDSEGEKLRHKAKDLQENVETCIKGNICIGCNLQYMPLSLFVIDTKGGMEKQAQRCRSLVLVPCPFPGHINPMLQFGAILYSKGFSITIAQTQFNFPDPSCHPDFTFLPISNGISNHNASSQNFIDFLTGLNVNCEAPLHESLKRMVKEQDFSDDLPCIIYDEYMYSCEAVAHDLKLPSIILCTASVANLLTCHAFPNLRKESYLPLLDSMSMNPLPGLYPLRFKDPPISNFENLDALLQLLVPATTMRSSLAIIFNTMDCLEHSSLAQLQQRCQVPIFAVGPMNKIIPTSSSLLEEESSCIAWLDKEIPKTVIYASLGSTASMDEKEVAEMAWGLANSKQPFLWVIRTDSNLGVPDGFIETIGESGYMVKWAPQKEVLAHAAVGGFWSHCGWNSTLESISEGVPIICKPCFGDQRVNARYVSYI